MTIHSVPEVEVERQELADYAILLAESTLVLSALASAPTLEARAEELADLRAVHAEGAHFTAHTPASTSLRQMFDAVVRIGADLSLQTHTATHTLWQVNGIQRVAQALAVALDEPDSRDPLHRLNQELHDLDPQCAAALDMSDALSEAARITQGL